MTRVASLETVTLADAVDRVRELSLRLWAVRAAHPPRRGLLGTRCSTCGHAWPCPTVRATGSTAVLGP